MTQKFRIVSLWNQLRSGFWFTPGLMILGAIALVFIVISMDRHQPVRGEILGRWLADIGPAGARTLFSTIAASTITVTGVIFSISMVVLTMASSQFGPRLIPTFMRAGRIQIGFGMFLGTCIYALLMLALVPLGEGGLLPSAWSIIVGLALGILSFVYLVFLIHEISTFVQAPNVTARVAADIETTFGRIFPERASADESTATLSRWGSSSRQSLTALGDGYVQTIDYDALAGSACADGYHLHILVKPGHFVFRGATVAHCYGDDIDHQAVETAVWKGFRVGRNRDLAQDAEYAVDQMNEIALRALSPGINDPFTAINCIDKLGSALAFLATRHPPDPVYRDERDEARLVATPDTFESIINSAFDQIRQNADDKPAVMLRLLASMERLAGLEPPRVLLDAILAQYEKIADSDACRFPFPGDQADFEGQVARTGSALRRAR